MEKEFFFEGNSGEKLISVHTNKARDNQYYYDWSSDLKGWVKGEKVPPEVLISELSEYYKFKKYILKTYQ